MFRRGGPEPGRIGIPCEIEWNDSSHSILNEFMHAEYAIFVYTIWPLFGAQRTPISAFIAYVLVYDGRARVD